MIEVVMAAARWLLLFGIVWMACDVVRAWRARSGRK